MNEPTQPLSPVAPAEPPAPWIGGKKLLARRICAILAATRHDAYAEPFVGLGGVFLRRTMRPAVEVLNDVAGDVVNLFRVLQRHPEALLRELRWRPSMRAEFDRLKGARPQDFTDIERAARFLYLQTLAYAGKVMHRSFGVSPEHPKAFDLRRLEPRLQRLHDRLAGVIIEHQDWSDFLPLYDAKGTLFYLDPPYWASEGDYGSAFGRRDFQCLADALQGLKGRFLFSINDVPEIRAMFGWADMIEVETAYTIQRDGSVPLARELLIGRGVDLSPAAGQGRLL